MIELCLWVLLLRVIPSELGSSPFFYFSDLVRTINLKHFDFFRYPTKTTSCSRINIFLNFKRHPKICKYLSLRLSPIIFHGVLGTTLLGTIFNLCIAILRDSPHNDLDKVLLNILLILSFRMRLRLLVRPFCSSTLVWCI